MPKRCALSGALLLATVAVATVAAAQDVTFSEQTPLERDSHKYAPTVNSVDFDHDGDTDFIAFANYHEAQIAWWENTSGGDFEIHVVDNSAANTKWVSAGDLDGDGDTDFVAIVAAYGLVWYENGGDGQQFKRRVIRKDSGGFFVRLGDFNGDRQLDIALAGGQLVGVKVLYGEEDGQWSNPQDIGGQLSANGLLVADFNQDGADDLAEIASPKIMVHRSRGGRSFSSRVVYDYEGAAKVTAEVHDVDADGYPDLLVTDLRFVDYLKNLEGRSFTPQQSAEVIRPRDSEADLQRIDVADFNGDGKNDLLLGRGRGIDIAFRRGFGKGGSAEEGLGLWDIQRVYKEPKSIILNVHPADVDGDGNVDLVNFGHLGRGNLYWLKNE